jgi:hypothetical protein
MSPEEETLTKVVTFAAGPIKALGYTRATIRECPGYMAFTHALTSVVLCHGLMVLFTREGERWLKPLDGTMRPERQLRHIVRRMEADHLLTPEQREKAYAAFGLGEDG